MKAGQYEQNLADGLPVSGMAGAVVMDNGEDEDDDDEEAPKEMIVEAGLLVPEPEGHDVGDIADSDNESLEEVNALTVGQFDIFLAGDFGRAQYGKIFKLRSIY